MPSHRYSRKQITKSLQKYETTNRKRVFITVSSRRVLGVNLQSSKGAVSNLCHKSRSKQTRKLYFTKLKIAQLTRSFRGISLLVGTFKFRIIQINPLYVGPIFFKLKTDTPGPLFRGFPPFTLFVRVPVTLHL